MAIPKRAITHIQKIEPGPPKWIAVATPAILPVPTVADIAVIKAWNGDIVPSALLEDLEGCARTLSAEVKFLHGNALVMKVKYMPVHANNGIKQYSLQISSLKEDNDTDRLS